MLSFVTIIWIQGPKQGAYGDASAGEELFTEGEGYTEDDDEEEDDGQVAEGSYEELEASTVGSTGVAQHNFNWLDTSLVENANGGPTAVPSSPLFQPASHHLANYGNSRSALSASRSRMPTSPAPSASGTHSPHSKRKTGHHKDRDHYPRQPRWHFGIRSSSPPMEVMLELYRTLEALGIQWRQKRGIWAASEAESHAALQAAEQYSHTPGSEASATAGDSYEGEPRENLDVYYVECRWRIRNSVVSVDFICFRDSFIVGLWRVIAV